MSKFAWSESTDYLGYLKGNNTQHNSLCFHVWACKTNQHIQIYPRPDEPQGNSSGNEIDHLTDAEKADRERQRNFTTGVRDFFWFQGRHKVLLLEDGNALTVEISENSERVELLYDAKTRKTRASGFQLSPTNRYLSYVRDNDLYVRDISNPQSIDGEIRITTDGDDVVSNGLADFIAAEEMHRHLGHWWSKDDKKLYFTKVDTSKVQISTRTEINADQTRSLEQRYPYAGEDNADSKLFEYDLDSSVTRELWRNKIEGNEYYLSRVHVTKSGLYIQTQDRLQRNLLLKKLSANTGEWVELHRESSMTWTNLSDDFIELDNQTLAITDENNDQRKVSMVNNTKLYSQELDQPAFVNKIVSADDNFIYVEGWDATPVENHLFRVPLNGELKTQLTKLPGWHQTTFSRDSAFYVDQFTSTQVPMMTIVCNTASSDGKEPKIIYQENINDLHPYKPFIGSHADSEIGFVQSHDETKIYYKLTKPAKTATKTPIIVYVYGGPGVQKVKNEWSSMVVQLFAQNGFGVLELDNRGSSNRGRSFEQPIYKSLGGVEIEDQLLGLDMLKEIDWADSENVGIFGHSYGGYMTLMGLCQSTRFCAGVSVAPVSDWRLYDTHYTERYMGLPIDNEEGYAKSNVINQIHTLKSPLLLMHGMADDNVLFTHSTLLMSALQKHGKDFDLMTYPGAKHSMQEEHVSIHRFRKILSFFNFHLKRPADL